MTSRLRLLTMNIEGNRSPWRDRKGVLQKLLADEQPELAALHEVLRPHGTGTTQAHELAGSARYHIGFGRASSLVRPFPSEFGSALLSRFPVREQRTEPLPSQGKETSRALLYELCSVKVGLLPLYVTHLSAAPEAAEERQAQLAHIGRYIAAEQAALPSRVPAQVAILPPILVGELGVAADAPELEPLRELGLIDGLLEMRGGDWVGRRSHVLIGTAAAGQPSLRVHAARHLSGHGEQELPALIVELALALALATTETERDGTT